MKKFTKLFLSSALVAAMAMSSMVAFADGETPVAGGGSDEPTVPTSYDITGDVKGTYDVAQKKVILSTEEGDNTWVADVAANQATFLVYNSTGSTTQTPVTAAQDNVVGIDQKAQTAGAVSFDNMGLIQYDQTAHAKGVPTIASAEDTTTNQTYTVMVGYYNAGGTFVTKSGKFTVSNAQGEEFKLGNVDGDDFDGKNGIGAGDASAILKYIAGTGGNNAGTQIKLVNALTVANVGTIDAGTELRLGDVDGDHFDGKNGVGAGDASAILKYIAGTGGAYAGQVVTATSVE